MALEMKASCELCSVLLGPALDAWICSFECTFCATCAASLGLQCKNCGGELVPRPRRGRVAVQAFGAVHRAEVSWQRSNAVFVDRRYSRVHRWSFEGGPELVASSSPHVVPVPLSDPGAVDPEGAFIAALSSCHMLWFLDLASRAGLVVERYRDQAEGVLISKTIGEAGAGRESHPALSQITLKPVVTFAAGASVPAELFERLHHEAHERCFLANALGLPPTVSPTATYDV
jgi:organic hydroperoxide reductase OsmC/OhrA